MYLEVYPDIIFILNFFFDIILLFILSKVNRKKSSWIRLMGASAIGAISAVLVSIFPWINIVIRFLLMNVAASALMVRLAFGKMTVRQLIKQMIALYLITYFAGGLINSVYYNTDVRERLIHISNSLTLSNLSWSFIVPMFLLLIPVAFLLLWLHRFYQSGKKETYEIELCFEDRVIHTTGLMDTGNCLYDPIYKKPVMVMETTLLKELLPLEIYKELEEAKSCLLGINQDANMLAMSSENARRFRIIPYQSIGKARGIMPGLILDKVLIHTGKDTVCNEKVTAAICDNHLSAKDDYHVILHKELI